MAGNTIWTISSLIQWTTNYFKNHNIEEPRLDAELLLSHVLHKPRIYLYTDFELIVNPDELALFKEYIKKRIAGFSTAAITGEKDFMGMTFSVNEHVLIPRPDSEAWMERVIQYHQNDAEIRVADLGTGSGCLLLSFLYYCKGATGIGIDISNEALEIAKKNSEKFKLEDRVEWRKADYLTGLGEDELFDGILSNPPYIPTKDINVLADEVKNEPILALDGGEDGLNFYRILAKDVSKFIKSGGFLALECGIHQSQEIVNLLKESDHFDSIEIIKDYGGIERAIYCRRK